jgi:hypothetical protein
MANVVKWGYNTQWIVFNSKEKRENPYIGNHTILVDTAKMDSDVQCMHCGKTIKSGKLVFVYYDFICMTSVAKSPYNWGDNNWGDDSEKLTFCSSSHAKLFAKNTN